MTLDPVLLSRLQFFWVVSFHILLPAFTVGLACYIAVLEALYLKTREHTYFRVSVFWTRIFAVSFGLGVVSGIVMPFQFGTNWSRFSDTAANVIGPLMAYEGLTAFFLEASFLGVLLFGRKLVPPWAHCFAAAMVAVGTLFSSFWILALNSWMQTPAGYEIIDGRFHAADWVAVIFNPSFPYRISHTVTAFLVTTGFVVARCRGVLSPARTCHRRGTHDALDDAVAAHRPGAAADRPRRPARAQYLPSSAGQARRHGGPLGDAVGQRRSSSSAGPIRTPRLRDGRSRCRISAASCLTHTLNGTVRGLKEWPREDRPPAADRLLVAFA